jgi:hypothetical protein
MDDLARSCRQNPVRPVLPHLPPDEGAPPRMGRYVPCPNLRSGLDLLHIEC